MLEEAVMQCAPAPARGIRPEPLAALRDGLPERIGEKRVALAPRLGAEASVGLFQGIEHAVDISGREELRERAVTRELREEARPQMAHPPNLEQGRGGALRLEGAIPSPEQGKREQRVAFALAERREKPRQAPGRDRGHVGLQRARRGDAVAARRFEHLMDARRARAFRPFMPDGQFGMRPIGGEVHLVRRRDEAFLRD